MRRSNAPTRVQGPLCKRGHDDGTGHSIRYASTRMCVACLDERPEDPAGQRRRALRYHYEHRDAELKKMANYRKTEAFKRSSARYRQENRAALAERVRAWKRTPHGKAVIHLLNAQRRAAVQGAVRVRYTSHDLVELLATWNGRCAYCLDPATTFDHVVALTRGGHDALYNLLPACRFCNGSKGNKPVEVWLEVV